MRCTCKGHCVVSTTITLDLTELTNYLGGLSPSLEASSCSVKKFPTFHPTQIFITTFTTARKFSLSWARPIQSTTYHYIFISILISPIDALVFQVVSFLQVSPVRTFSCPIRATCPAYFILGDFIIRIIRYWKSSLLQTRKWCIQSESESSS